jgi:hypothetical protein
MSLLLTPLAGNPLGLVYTLNFSKPFSTTDNMTAIFGTISKVSDGTAAKNLAPNYVDGAMLGNHEEWFLYGGLLRETKEFSPPAATNVLAYQKYQYGVQKDGFLPGFVYDDLPEDMTRYVAYGASAAAPSENKAWYFSGLRAQGYGPIYEPGFNESLTATNVSNTLITLDMTTQLQETWKNETLPADTPGRANPELVWVPVGKQGILVALGGVVFPDFSSYLSKSPNEAESKAQSPGFMSTIDIYDVASGTWYRQETTGGPGQLTRGCAVVAPAQDYSSFSIYYYGGYSGLSQTQPFNDDVWVLSIPSFTWTKVAEGATGGRAGHKCFMPYPDQMFVIGGYPPLVGSALTCLRETVRVLDLTTGTWRTSYDPSKWANYTIPEAVVSKIGGSPTGGATVTAPSPSGFASTGLAAVFGEKYPTAKIVNYYPYKPQAATNNTNPDLTPDVDVNSGGGGVPAFLPPVLGVVLGLMFLTMIAVLILLWRRRKLLRRRGGQSEAGTEDTNGHRIMSWMRGQTNSETKAGTVVSSDETTSSPDDLESVAPAHPQSMAEMMNTEIRAPVELPGAFECTLYFVNSNTDPNRHISASRTPRHWPLPRRRPEPLLSPQRSRRLPQLVLSQRLLRLRDLRHPPNRPRIRSPFLCLRRHRHHPSPPHVGRTPRHARPVLSASRLRHHRQRLHPLRRLQHLRARPRPPANNKRHHRFLRRLRPTRRQRRRRRNTRRARTHHARRRDIIKSSPRIPSHARRIKRGRLHHRGRRYGQCEEHAQQDGHRAK